MLETPKSRVQFPPGPPQVSVSEWLRSETQDLVAQAAWVRSPSDTFFYGVYGCISVNQMKNIVVYFMGIVSYFSCLRPELKDESDDEPLLIADGYRTTDLEHIAEAVLELREEVRLLDDPVNLEGG
jgi:hypothetical protein